MSNTEKLNGLEKAAVIARVTERNVTSKTWRDTATAEALAYLGKTEKSRKSDVIEFVRARYDEAGAGFSGRF